MHTKESGGGLVAIVALVAIAAVGGVWYMSTQSSTETENTASEADRQPAAAELPANTSEDVAAVDETRLAGDPMLEEMDDKDMAADGGAEPLELPEVEDEVVVTEEVSEPLPLAAGSYEAYSPEKLAKAETGDVVLFFHADWCPSCRGLESDINANLGNIPDGVHILKLDYDTETDLKKKYGVVRQHTLVQVDESGNAIKTLTGLTNTLTQVTGQL